MLKRILLFIIILGLSTSSAQEKPKSKPMNPDIGLNFLGLYQQGNQNNRSRMGSNQNGLQLQESEISFKADADPYFSGSALFSVAPAEAGGYEIDPEEIFAESLNIPSLTLKVGKFKTAFGKHNSYHTHAFPFIDAPLNYQNSFGDEGLNESGLSAAYLFTFPWYSELTLQGLSTSNEDFFNADNPAQIAEVIRFKNLWDLNSDLTFEWGLSGANGKNAFDKYSTALGSDITFKWRPAVGGKYNSWSWTTEYLYADRRGNAERLKAGIASWFLKQFSERWWIQARYEYMGLPKEENEESQQKQSLLLGFFPSEFSGIRLQYDHLSKADSPDGHNVALQFNLSLGAHPAHGY